VNYPFLTSLLLAVALAPPARAQTSLTAPAAAILREGHALYQLERAAWVSTDLLRTSHLPLAQVTDYFSYARADSVCTLFVGGPAAAPVVLAEYRYPQQLIGPGTARAFGPRHLLPPERRLLGVRQQSLADLQHIPGLELPAGASFNPVLLPKGDQTWVYVLTAATRPGVVVLGNDYLLRYNAQGRLLARRKLHPGPIPLGTPPAGARVRTTLHAHGAAAGAYITPTDVCTLLLYRGQLPGASHLVMSRKYVSIFSLADARLVILTRQDFMKHSARPAAGAGRP
jgi:hypothetical protein